MISFNLNGEIKIFRNFIFQEFKISSKTPFSSTFTKRDLSFGFQEFEKLLKILKNVYFQQNSFMNSLSVLNF
jgi:hypothetical protein